MQPPTVHVGPWPATLQPPSVAKCFELHAAWSRWQADPGIGDGYLIAVQAAALRLCWPSGVTWPTQIPPGPLRLGERLADWGEAVLEGLVGAGLDPAAVVSPAGAVAVELCRSRLPRKAAVDAAVGNSAAPPAGSFGASSDSADGGAVTLSGGTA